MSTPKEAHPLEAWQDASARPYVQLQRVTRQYGDIYAVDDVSLNVYQGEFFFAR